MPWLGLSVVCDTSMFCIGWVFEYIIILLGGIVCICDNDILFRLSLYAIG
jgi:hypothetical protein